MALISFWAMLVLLLRAAWLKPWAAPRPSARLGITQ